MTAGPSTLTVVICTHNRVELLLRTLDYLNACRYPQGWQVQALVVANACSDDTIQCLTRFHKEAADGLSLTWIEEPVPGKSNALNSAIPKIQSDLVAFVDDDHRVDRDYLVHICRTADTYPEADLFCGRILPDWDGTEPDWVHDTGPFRMYPLPVPRFDQGDEPKVLGLGTAIPGGGNLFLRTKWLGYVGNFSADYGPNGHNLGGAEDLEWVKRALRMGARLQYVPEVLQYHYVDLKRLTLTYVLKKAFLRSASTVRLADDQHGAGVPAFMYRKIARYLFAALFSGRWQVRRFYLVRSAAALGEVQGYRRRRRDGLNKSGFQIPKC